MTLQEDFILGPQLPIGTSWLDQTLISKARQLGESCPVDPPTGDAEQNTYILLNYYDLPLSLYIAYKRTNDPTLQTLARKAADAWWKMPGWIGSGSTRYFMEGSATPPPRHAGIMGLSLRALDGRPEMWDWIVEYTRASMDMWLMTRINNVEPWYGLREGAFTMHFATILAKVLPDSYPKQSGGTETNGAAIRAKFLADVENVCLNYFGRFQQSDGSWRWGNVVGDYGDTKFTLAAQADIGSLSFSVKDPVPETIPIGEMPWIGESVFKVTAVVPAGSKTIPVQQQTANGWGSIQQTFAVGTVGQYAPMVNMMQPFMVGLLLCALCDAYEIVQTPTVKDSIKKQILTGCRFLYASGPYTRLVVFGTPIRGFHYFFGGGTTVNPTKYANGDLTVESMTSSSYIWDARQAISTILPSFGKAFQLSGDTFYRDAANEMYDSAYGGEDGYRSYIDTEGKGYNQHARRVGSLIAWMGSALVQPASVPTPVPAPSPTPTPTPQTPSPDNTKAVSIVDSQGAVWTLGAQKQTLKNGVQMGGGVASIYKYSSQVVYALGTDSNWYKWSGSWVSVGTTEPGSVTPTPAPTPTPTPTPVPTTIRKLAQPSTEAKWNTLLAAQKLEGYYLTKFLTGAYVQFEKLG